MSRPLILRPAAEADVEDAFQWYEGQNPGLGAEFLRALEAALSSIEREPELYAPYHKQARRVLLRRFPYAVFYLIQPHDRRGGWMFSRAASSTALAFSAVAPGLVSGI